MRNLRATLSVAVFWSLGGALNAAHCYFFPLSKDYTFKWHIIPAGALHGLVLAAVPVLFALFFSNKNLFFKILGLVAAGYTAGWVSGIFLGFSIEEKWALSRLWWPVRGGFSVEDSLIGPFSFFGTVSVIYYFFLCLLNKLRDPRPGVHISAAVVSGVLGSLWFWVDTKPWPISLLHGAVWGLLTGFGTWQLNRKA